MKLLHTSTVPYLTKIPTEHTLDKYVQTCQLLYCTYLFSDISDLFDIHYELRSVASNWKDVGLALRLDPDTLNEIEADCKNVKNCLREVLAKWLKKLYNTSRYGPPSWKLLVAAVGHPAGGNNLALAEKIAERHNGKCIHVVYCAVKSFAWFLWLLSDSIVSLLFLPHLFSSPSLSLPNVKRLHFHHT